MRRITALQCVIRSTRYMWIPMLWQDVPVAYDAETETWSDVIYMPCTMENNFVPELPKETPDIIYLCLPNNPTGTTITKDQLQVLGRLLQIRTKRSLFTMQRMRLIFQRIMWRTPSMSVQGAKTCAIELKSFL